MNKQKRIDTIIDIVEQLFYCLGNKSRIDILETLFTSGLIDGSDYVHIATIWINISKQYEIKNDQATTAEELG